MLDQFALIQPHLMMLQHGNFEGCRGFMGRRDLRRNFLQGDQMIRGKQVFALMALMAVVALSGCTQRVADFTLLSSKNVELSRAAEFEHGKQRAEGRSNEAIILFIPTGTPNVKAAVDEAIESVPGAVALADGVVYSHSFFIPLLGGAFGYRVEGTPIIDPKFRGNAAQSTQPEEGEEVEPRFPY